MGELGPKKALTGVWGRSYEVLVHQQDWTLWSASGEYRGEWYKAMAATEDLAIRRWAEWAHSKGKDEPARSC